MDQQATVYIIDDDEGTRRDTRRIVESIHLPVETYRSSAAFLDAFRPNAHGCVVVVAQLPGTDVLALHIELQRRDPFPVILVTVDADISLAVRAIRAGIIDVLQRPFSDEELLDSVRRALAEDTRRREDQVRFAEVPSRFGRLTPREREVMAFVVDGKTNKEIAATLNRSAKTVEVHRAQVMRKMRVDSLGELVRVSLTIGPGPAPASRRFPSPVTAASAKDTARLPRSPRGSTAELHDVPARLLET